MVGMSRSANKVRKLPSLKIMLISVEKRSFRIYVTDVPGAVNDCYIGRVLDIDHVDLLEESTKRYESYKGIE